ncbi:unnamed protein product [Adineta steineri]|uniref:EGF-like domain-containing protein n=1 Tax=Adineta steineri TaxID=433720 RepID=A0A818Y6K0_9BILA|nr:unnamed protein product [Adineta steineri]
MLNSPQGIYVDSNLNLYIADSANNRIQFIQTGQLNGVAVVGNGSSANIILNYPTGIVLDANGYLFIVDSYNHRIVGSSSTGFRCIVGCSGGGSTAFQLSFPQSVAFDSYGNIYVTDRNNSRVQQFALQTNNCTIPTTTTTTTTSSSSSTTTSTTTTTTSSTTSSSSTTSTTSTTTSTSSTTSSTTTSSSSTTSSTSVTTTTTTTTTPVPPAFYCPGTNIGAYCNVTSDACSMSQPCLNAATCFPDLTVPVGYRCGCQTGYTGSTCENDERICKDDTCWNNGTCIEVNSTTVNNNGTNFYCNCSKSFTGVHCELKVNLCVNIKCQNHGICQTVNMSWSCICLTSLFYYGNYCEIETSALKVKQALSKSFASVAITVLVLTCSFVIIMDVLKYVFKIDPIKAERLKQLQAKKSAKSKSKPKARNVAVRFQYVA